MPYIIQKNEKISDIVNKFDIPYNLIQRFNPYIESIQGVYPGQSLSLPLIYSVLPGETYESIGKTYSVIPSYMKELNPYIDEQPIIYPGQTVFLPPTA